MAIDYNGAGLGVKRYLGPESYSDAEFCEVGGCPPSHLQAMLAKGWIKRRGDGRIPADALKQLRTDRSLSLLRHAKDEQGYKALDRAVWLSAADLASSIAHPRVQGRRIDPAIVQDLMNSGSIESRVCEKTGDRLATRAAFRNFAGLHREGLQIIRARQLKKDDDATLARIAGEKENQSESEMLRQVNIEVNRVHREKLGLPVDPDNA